MGERAALCAQVNQALSVNANESGANVNVNANVNANANANAYAGGWIEIEDGGVRYDMIRYNLT